MEEIAALSMMLSVVAKSDAYMPINELRTLLYFHEHPGSTVNSLQEAFGFDTATCSRVVGRLGERAAPGKKGHGFVVLHTDDSNIRRKMVYLTPKGMNFLQRVAAAGSEVMRGKATR
jgi:DNA-binding MarR family transcriptional regulator